MEKQVPKWLFDIAKTGWYRDSKSGGLSFSSEYGGVLTHEQFAQVVREWKKFYLFYTPEQISAMNEWSDAQAEAWAGGVQLTDYYPTYEGWVENGRIIPRYRPDPEPAIFHGVYGFVYLIQAENGLFKIGRTKDLEKRMEQLRKNSPFKLELLHHIETDNSTGLEKELHKRFRTKRREGEWFALDNDDVAVFLKIKRHNDLDLPF